MTLYLIKTKITTKFVKFNQVKGNQKLDECMQCLSLLPYFSKIWPGRYLFSNVIRPGGKLNQAFF